VDGTFSIDSKLNQKERTTMPRLNKTHVLGILIALVPLSLAAEPAKIVKYRQAYMSAIGGHVGGLASLVKGEYEAEGHLAIHADAVSKLVTADDITALFPEGSATEKSHALPAIWDDFDDFAEKAKAAEHAAQAMNEAAQSGDKAAIGKAMGALGKSCRNCHDDYRERHDH
jgi:cytochrome c556